MMEDKISMNESIEAGAPSIKYDQGDIRMGQGGDEQGRQVAAQIWEQMEQEQKVQFGSLMLSLKVVFGNKLFNRCNKIKVVNLNFLWMTENVNMQEQMPGGGIADVDMREQVQMAANGGLMGLYNRGM